MKLLHLLSQRPDSTGSGFYVQAIINEASQKGHQNHLVAGAPKHAIPDTGHIPAETVSFVPFEGEELPYAIPGMSDVMPYRSSRFMDLTHRQLDQYKTCFKKKIALAVDAVRPDIIHTNHLWLMTALVREMFPEIPTVTSCHGTDLRQLKNCDHLRTEVVLSCRNVDRVIALSKSQKTEIIELFGIPEDRIIVAGSGFNDALFSFAAKPQAPPVKIVYAGKLSNAKGVPWLLESLRINVLEGLPFHLYLAGSGDGPEKDTCLSLAGQMKDKVTVCGALKQHELATLMQQAHIFILPSFFEGLPLVLFEALASGCRVITTALPGTQEIAGNNASGLVRFIDLPPLETVDSPYESDMPLLRNRLADALAAEIKSTLKQPNIDPGEIKKLTDNFTWKEVFSRIENVYCELMG